ncbi:lactaldehyde reductase [Christensenella minuta]|uniref:Lactaldehyde reductase n=1 Tax=Christensenella minuta TaxID=626937 RepID=A0A136Q817_9FIRM|nr:lactaldehyde reductase [Christensenella minuta]AYH40333.1 lactaldehyde reductase [Christensenella minuta]KXK66724.1 lactaldehyde reductase [Christensenella minuta]OAQ40206.1 lactaldehyde reductase [Christensenella minuta]
MPQRVILNETSYFGQGALANLPAEISRRGFRKALIITDADLVKFGVAAKVTELLDANGMPYNIFSQAKANPTVEIVKRGVNAFRVSGADYLIAVGGGSSIDTAKAVGIIAGNPEFSDVVSLEGTANTLRKAAPTIAIPTTAGTAAEVTINYVITDEEKKRKFVCVDVHDIPQIAIVDPEMMASMPRGLAASTGMDALTHAIEGYVTKGAWEMTDMFHLQAIKMIAKNLKDAVNGDMKAREEMANAQYIAGMGFSNVGLGVVHGMAHPLGAFYDTPHGVANAVLLPYVMEHNQDATGEKYREIARAMGVANVDNMSQEEYRRAAIEAVRALSRSVEIPQTLAEIGVKEEDLEELAKSAFCDVCTGGNPKDMTEESILGVYRWALKG